MQFDVKVKVNRKQLERILFEHDGETLKLMTEDVSQIEKYDWVKNLKRIEVDAQMNTKIVEMLKRVETQIVEVHFKQEQKEYMKQLSDLGFNVHLNNQKWKHTTTWSSEGEIEIHYNCTPFFISKRSKMEIYSNYTPLFFSKYKILAVKKFIFHCEDIDSFIQQDLTKLNQEAEIVLPKRSHISYSQLVKLMERGIKVINASKVLFG